MIFFSISSPASTSGFLLSLSLFLLWVHLSSPSLFLTDCHFRTATPPHLRRWRAGAPETDSDSDSDSDSEADTTINDDRSLASSIGPRITHHHYCCARHRQRAGSTASSSFSAAELFAPPPPSPTVRIGPPRRPSLPSALRPRLLSPSSLHFRTPASFPDDRLLSGGLASFPEHMLLPEPDQISLASFPEPRLLSLAPPKRRPSPPPPPAPAPPAPVVEPDGLEEMPMTRMWLAAQAAKEAQEAGPMVPSKPIKGFKRSYISLKLDWHIGLMRTRKRVIQVRLPLSLSLFPLFQKETSFVCVRVWQDGHPHEQRLYRV